MPDLDVPTLNRLIQVRAACHGDLPALALVDIALACLLAKGDWPGMKGQQLLESFKLLEEAQAIADDLGDDPLKRQVDGARHLIAARQSHPAERAFVKRDLREVLAGPPICRFVHQPDVRGLYLRALDSANDLRIHHSIDEHLIARLRTIPTVAANDGRLSLESVLAVSLPFAVMSVGGARDASGVARTLTEDSNWKDAVRYHLRGAAESQRSARKPRPVWVFFVVPASGAGILWELRALRRYGLLPATFFVMPPANASNVEVREEWSRLRPVWESASGARLPQYDPAGALLRFDTAGHVLEVIALDDVCNGSFGSRLLGRPAEEAGSSHQVVWTMTDLTTSSPTEALPTSHDGGEATRQQLVDGA